MRLASQEVGRYDLRPTSCSTNNLLRQAFPLASVHTYAAALLSNLLLRETSNLSPTWYGRMYGRGGAGNISKARQGSEKAAAVGALSIGTLLEGSNGSCRMPKSTSHPPPQPQHQDLRPHPTPGRTTCTWDEEEPVTAISPLRLAE